MSTKNQSDPGALLAKLCQREITRVKQEAKARKRALTDPEPPIPGYVYPFAPPKVVAVRIQTGKRGRPRVLTGDLEDAICDARAEYGAWYGPADIAKRFGVSARTVGRAVRNIQDGKEQ